MPAFIMFALTQFVGHTFESLCNINLHDFLLVQMCECC